MYANLKQTGSKLDIDFFHNGKNLACLVSLKQIIT